MPKQALERVSDELVGLLGLSPEVPLSAPTAPTIAFVDGDVTLFAAASVCEQVNYVYETPEGLEVSRFDSAKSGSAWIAEFEIFGIDTKFGFKGDPDTLVRRTEYIINPTIENGQKSFKSDLKKVVKQSGCTKYTCYVSKSAGADNFRHHIASIAPYKGNRSSRKPEKLEEMRKWALKNTNVKKVIGTVEVDDVVQAYAQRNGDKAVLIAFDKDARTASGCWVLIPPEMESPEYSDPYIVGTLAWNDKANKPKGLGWLFLLWQSLAGDTADNIKGCKGMGDKGAYKLLAEFDNAHINRLPEAVNVVAEVYKKTYGDHYEYKHCITNELINSNWQNIMIENLRLLYMLKNKNDSCPLIKLISV